MNEDGVVYCAACERASVPIRRPMQWPRLGREGSRVRIALRCLFCGTWVGFAREGK